MIIERSAFFVRPAALLAIAIGLFYLIPPSVPAGDYGKVELVRDQWGVPHIFAKTDEGAMYGLGYASAEDRSFQMHYSLRIMQGRLAETIGAVKQSRRDSTAVDLDRKVRTFGFYRAAQALAVELDDESRRLLEAYSAGVNAYLKDNADDLAPVFAKVGLAPEPWSPADCIVSWWHLAQFFATDGTRDLMRYRNLTEGDPRRQIASRGRGGPTTPQRRTGRAAQPRGGGGRQAPAAQPVESDEDLKPMGPDDAASVVQRGDVSQRWVNATRSFMRKHGFQLDDTTRAFNGPAESPKFSHAWVADGKTTGTGAAVLVSKPQTPVTNPSLLYEFHVKGDTIDARGCGVAGSPIILIGWTRKVAWGMTALGADQADLFRLKTDDEHPDQYQFDGEWRPIRTIREQIKVKGGRTQNLEVRMTHFGPIVNQFAFSRPRDPLVAMKRVPLCEKDRDTLQGALAMMRAGNVDEFFEALADWRFPTANVVFGDREGRIGYSTAGALVLRSPESLEGGSAAHDGSASHFGWRTIIPHKLVPHVIDPKQGYLFSGNHRPIASFYPIPIGIRTGSGGDTLRSLRLRQMFANYESLTDEALLTMSVDAVNPARAAIVRVGLHLRDVLKRDLSRSANSALEQLEAWRAAGSSTRLDAPGAALASQINTMFRFVNTDLTFKYGGGDSGLSRLTKTLEKRLNEDPKAEISPLEQEWVDRLLAQAWESCQRNYRSDDPADWNQRAQKQVTQRTMGYFESLDGFPSVDRDQDLKMPALACVDGATISSQAAEAYVQWVPLANVDGARSILPPGQSERPDDTTRTVNVENWAAGKLHPAPISREAVDRIATSTRTLAE